VLPAPAVADASLAVKWVVREPYSAEARRLLRDWEGAGVTPVAPMLFATECAQALYRRVTLGQITIAQAQGVLDALLARGVKVMRPTGQVLKRAMEIAAAVGLPTLYDSQYAATAEHLGAEFWTADRAFRDAAHPALPFVHWIGERVGIV
jgi:predicted nucleic acid-binding protein